MGNGRESASQKAFELVMLLALTRLGPRVGPSLGLEIQIRRINVDSNEN